MRSTGSTLLMQKFGEYLVAEGIIDRVQLLRVLQMQNRVPGIRLGACAVALGYLRHAAVERLYTKFAEAEREAQP